VIVDPNQCGLSGSGHVTKDISFISYNQIMLSANIIIIISTPWSLPKGFKGYCKTMMLEGHQGQSFTDFLKTKAFRRV
jgi:hypothetical protein